MRLVFDIEADGYLHEVTKIHCLCVEDLDTGEQWGFGPQEIQKGLELLGQADEIIAHNGIGYDYPALEKVEGWIPFPNVRCRDSMLLGYLLFPDLKEDDFKSGVPYIESLAGKQSLWAWGVRLGHSKTDYQGGFETFNQEMFDYCQQDTRVTVELMRYLEEIGISDEAEVLETDFAIIAERMSVYGFPFDLKAAEKLSNGISESMEAIAASLREKFPGEQEQMKTPAYWLMTWDTGVEEKFDTKGKADAARKAAKLKPSQVSIKRGPNKVRIHDFNPNSRKQIRERLYQKYGWLSPKLTDTGEKNRKKGNGSHKTLAEEYGSVEEDILRELDFDEAEELADYLLLSKIQGMVATGANSWLKLVKPDQRIHHRLLTLGCATTRCSHSGPNLGQVPSVSLDKKTGKLLWGMEGRFGADCRACFTASEGHSLVGVDLSGIEARMLAHFLSPFDGGAYIDQVLNGDIHQLNVDAFQKSAGYVVERNASKNVFYGWLYGAGMFKIGALLITISDEAKGEYDIICENLQKSLTPDRAGAAASLMLWGTPKKPIIGLDEYQEKQYSRWCAKLMRGLTEQDIRHVATCIVGAKIHRSFQEGIGGLRELLNGVKSKASRGYLSPLDGRKIPVRKEHAALNTLLQGSAAIVAKRWVVGCFNKVDERNITAQLMAFVHDETQSDVLVGHEERYIEASLQAITEAGEHYQLAIPLGGEAKFGANWAETH